MTAKEVMSIDKSVIEGVPKVTVNADMPVIEVVSHLLDAPQRIVGVEEQGEFLGIIDQTSLLEGLGRMIAPRDDCSVISVECAPDDYSASVLSHAIEDTDAHLVDLLTVPASNGMVKVTMRVRHADPTSAVRSLERYGYNVVEVHGATEAPQSLEITAERLLSLQALMNV